MSLPVPLLIPLAASVIILTMSFFILRSVYRSDMDVIASRVFLREEDFKEFLSRFTYMVVLLAVLMGLAHYMWYIASVQASSIFVVLMRVFFILSAVVMAGTVYVFYDFLHTMEDLEGEEDKESGGSSDSPSSEQEEADE
ncbi:MAG: hypothetical protein ABEJ69_00800 [Candidatus Nanohaloarchaea archaeon]